MLRLVAPRTEPATCQPTWRTTLRDRWTVALHRALNRLGVPGAIQPTSYRDALTGQQIDVTLGVYFTVVSVNGRDYYFRRISGRFDGTGSGCGTCH